MSKLREAEFTPGLHERLKKCRGMSDPFSFTFTIDPVSKIMTAHAVVFTSFVGHPEGKCFIPSDDCDPRMMAFINFVWANFLKERRKLYADLMDAVDRGDETKRRELLKLIKETERHDYES